MFNDEQYYINIRNSLIARAKAVRVDSNGNLLNLSVLSEGYYREILNILLGCNLVNANTESQNAPGIDLIDLEKRIAAQVSVTCDPKHIREKIKHSIEGFDVPENETWQFYFIPITDDAPKLGKDFELPEGLVFDKQKDVLDIKRIMQLVRDAGIDIQEALSQLVSKYDESEKDHRELRKRLDDLLLATWKSHRSYKLMQTDDIDKRLFPNIKDAAQFEALGKRKDEDAESPVWSIIRESWNEETNHPVMIQGGGGIGKTVTLFSLTNLDKDTIPAPAVYVPMFELVNRDGKVINLTDYFQSVEFFPSLTPKQREEISILAAKPWAGPSLLVLLDGFNEISGNQRWNVLQMLRIWHDKNPGAQLIAVSRPMDNLNLETAFSQETVSITLSELTRESVEAYLKSSQGNGVRMPDPEEPIWETIVYPLFLNLYIKTDKLRGQQVWKDYPLDVREAVGPGSLIWNFLQRELLRYEDDSWILRCAVASEYLSPILAHQMIQRYDYTISRREAVSVIQNAISEMKLERMPTHVAKLFSWWEDQTLAMGPPAFLKDLDWADIVLRESGLLVPYQEIQVKKTEKKSEQRFEFLHQTFRDCLSGLYLVNQAEITQENKFPEVWGQSQSHLALNYASELIDKEFFSLLWEANRKAQQYGDNRSKTNHTAICNLLEMWKRNDQLTSELDFSGMDLRGLSLTHYLEKDGQSLPLFRSRNQSKHTLLDRAVFESKGHTDTINALAVLPDGRIISGSNDNTIQVWDASTGQCLQTLTGHSGRINCVVVLSATSLVSGSDDHTLRVWNANTGECLQTLKGHSQVITCISVLPNGLVVSGSHDTLRLWDINSGQCLQTMKGHLAWIICMTALSNGLVVSGSYDNTLRVWDSATGKCLQVLEGHNDRISCIAVLPDDKVVSGSWDKTLRVWDAKTGRCLQVLEGHNDRISCVTTLKDGLIISGSFDHTLRVWNAATGQSIQVLEGHNREILCLADFWDGRVVSGAKDTTLRVWDTATGQCLQTLETNRASVTSVAVLPDGRVISGSKDNTLRIWDSSTSRCLQSLEGHRGAVSCVSILPNGHIACGSYDHTLRIWDVSTGQCLQTLRGHNSGVYCMAVLPNGNVISGSYDHTLRVWDATTGRCLQTLIGHRGTVYCVAILPNGYVVSGSHDTTLRIWNASTGECLQLLQGHSQLINCITVLPDGRVISASDDNTLRIWDTSTGMCLKTLEGHKDWVRCITVLPDGRVVSGSKDKTLRIWDIATGQCMHTLERHRRGIYCVASLPDGHVISGSSDSTLRVWNADEGQYLQKIGSHRSTVYCMLITSDRQIISGSYDNTLRVWDVETRQCLQILKGHAGRVFCMAMFSDGRVVSGSHDGTLRVWDRETGNCLDVLEAMEVRVSMKPEFKMDFSDANLTDDLARLLWHNGAKISDEDYNHWVKPYRTEK